MVKIARSRLLVIGGTGFIGYHLILKAKKKRWKVTSVSLHKPKKFRYVRGVQYIRVDISNYKKLKKKIKGSYDYIVNLGGYGKHSSYLKDGGKIVDDHFLGLVNLTKIFHWKRIKKFIQIGSSDEYGEAKSPQKENSQGFPTTPYALAKLACTNYLIMMNRINNYPVSILRFFLVYGPFQDKNRILPQVIEGCVKNKKIPVSPGNQIRDFCYIEDVIRAIFLTLKSKNTNGEILNIGSGKPQKIKKVVKNISKIIGAGQPQFGKKKYRKNENMKLYPDIKKARYILKWKPRVNLNSGLKIVINSLK